MQFSLKSINTYLLYCIVLVLPLFPKLLPPLIVFLAVSSIVLIIKDKLTFQFNWSRMALVAFFMLLVLGVSRSENKPMAWFDLEVKLSLIVFPLIYSFIPISKKELIIVFKMLVLGLVISSCILFYNSTIAFQRSGSYYEYFYVYFSRKIHPSYLSMYLVLAITALLLSLKNEKYQIFKNTKLTLVLVIIFYIINTLLLSKTGIIIGNIVLGYFFIDWLIRSKKYVLGILLFIGVTSGFYSLYSTSEIINKKVKEMFSAFDENDEDPDSSSSIRVKIWNEGLIAFGEKPVFGYGTGDVKDVLMERYQEVGMTKALDKKLNAHNQLLQIGIALGAVGLLLFFTIFYTGLKDAWAKRNLYSAFFLIITFMYILPESCLENQAGTIFFGLFLSIFSQVNLNYSNQDGLGTIEQGAN